MFSTVHVCTRPDPDAPALPFGTSSSGLAPAANQGQETGSADERRAIAALACDGEDLDGWCQLPHYLLISLRLLLPPLGACLSIFYLILACGYMCAYCQYAGLGGLLANDASMAVLEATEAEGAWKWWAMRALSTWQRLLSRPAASLRTALSALIPQACMKHLM